MYQFQTGPRRALVSAAVTVLFCLFCVAALPSGYVTADDPMQLLLVSGAMTAGEPDGRTLYSNVLLMAPMSELFARWPGFDWYTANLVFLQTLALAGLCYAIISSTTRPLASVLLIFLLYGWAIGMMVNLQFTHAAAMAGGAGLVLLLWAGSPGRESHRWASVYGGFLCLAGSLLRLDAFLLAVALFAPLFILRLAAGGYRSVLPLVVTLLLVAGSAMADRASYAADAQWREFTAFRPPMLALFNDNKTVESDELQKLLDRVGWRPEEWRLFVDYRFVADEQAFQIAPVSTLAEATTGPRSPADAVGLLLAQKSAFSLLPAALLLSGFAFLPSQAARARSSARVKPGGARGRWPFGDPLRDRRAAALGLLGVWVSAASLAGYLLWAARLPRHVRLPMVLALALVAILLCIELGPGALADRRWRWLRRSLAGATLAWVLVFSTVLLVRDVSANLVDREIHAGLLEGILADRADAYYLSNVEYLRVRPPWMAPIPVERRFLPPLEFARTPLARPPLDRLGQGIDMIDAIARGDSVVVVAKPEFVLLMRRHLAAEHGIDRTPEVRLLLGDDPPGPRDRRIVAARFR